MIRLPGLSLPALVILAAGFFTGSLWAGEAMLLNVREGQIPNDTGLDDKTTFALETSEPLGGQALKVVFFKGDSFGMSRGGGLSLIGRSSSPSNSMRSIPQA